MVALDVHALTSGRVGAWVSRLAQDERVHARLSVARASSGVDLLRDLALVCVAGADVDPAGVVAAITGRFDRERLETLVLAAPGGGIEQVAQGRLLSLPRAADGSGIYAILDRTAARLLLGRERERVLASDAEPPRVDATAFGAVLEHDASAVPLLWDGAARVGAWKSLPADA